MKRITLHDKSFGKHISSEKILEAVSQVAKRLNEDMKGKNPLFICVLNGAFMFAADLLKQLTISCEITFIKLASYEGTFSSGTVKTIMGLDQRIKRRQVVIIEDIVDTGRTLDVLVRQLKDLGPKDVKCCSMLFKEAAFKGSTLPDYYALKISNRFVVGYGLDYSGLGRNLPHLYILDETKK